MKGRSAAGKKQAQTDQRGAPLKRFQPRLGRVALVEGAMDFVLIDLGTSPAPQSGSRLQSFTDETPSAELVVSNHQQRPYLIADVVSGAPRVGDMVVLIPKQTSAAPSASGAPAAADTPSRAPMRPPSGQSGARSQASEVSPVPNLVPSGAPTSVSSMASEKPASAPERKAPVLDLSEPNERPADPAPSSNAIIPGLPSFGKKPAR